ncbi:MAG: CPXCG motif-containing cysteine-rich protein [Elusimicrobia bacterium]|nr:CPXCG motif-containing cysteine-rich protein [Elusimicrobiota bacterium]
MPGPRDEELQSVFNEVSAAPSAVRTEQWLQVACPYCSEDFEVRLTSEEDGQSLYEDCQVCCRPIVLRVSNEDGELQVDAHRS